MDKKQYYTNFLQKIVIGWVPKTIFRGQALKSWIQYRQKLSLFRALTFSRFLWVQQFLLTVSAPITHHSWLNHHYNKIWINRHFFYPKVHLLRLFGVEIKKINKPPPKNYQYAWIWYTHSAYFSIASSDLAEFSAPNEPSISKEFFKNENDDDWKSHLYTLRSHIKYSRWYWP